MGPLFCRAHTLDTFSTHLKVEREQGALFATTGRRVEIEMRTDQSISTAIWTLRKAPTSWKLGKEHDETRESTIIVALSSEFLFRVHPPALPETARKSRQCGGQNVRRADDAAPTQGSEFSGIAVISTP
jgi:hypothetical protein